MSMTNTVQAPDLAGRMARCTYYNGRKARGPYSSSSCKNGRDAETCTCEEVSSRELAFFEFCGNGSRDATLCQHCGCVESAHSDSVCPRGLRTHAAGTRYEPQGGQPYDRFYCGCHGWD